MNSFDEFWARYPRHVGKLAAQKAYVKALKLATATEILAGIERYKQAKPSYADYCFPATFLNQGRWMDEAPQSSSDCQHDPPCPSKWAHGKLVEAEATGDADVIAAVRRLYLKAVNA